MPDRSDRLNLQAAVLEAVARGDVGDALKAMNEHLGPSPADTPSREELQKRADTEDRSHRVAPLVSRVQEEGKK
jgi:hypothetical protein